MLAIDVFTAYLICGAGSLVGAAMLRLVDSSQADAAVALRFFTWALVLLGISLVSILFQGPVPGRAGMIASSSGTLAAVVLWVWGLGHLSGDKVSMPLMLALIVLAPSLPPVAASLGPYGMAIGFSTGLLVTSLLAVYAARSFIAAPRDAAERVLGGLVAGLALTSLLRSVWTLGYEGEPQLNLLHVPPVMQPIFAMFYGVLPFFISTTLLVVINGRLRVQLGVRASTDELTGVKTRRALRELAPGQIELARRSRLATALLMLDLDHFKSINDRYGHATGDLVLHHAAKLWQEGLRPDSLLARYGGEEFVALVPVEDLREARIVAERLRSAVANARWDSVTPASIRVTTSVGVTLVNSDETLDEAMHRADEAMYQAKGEGRNRVQVALRAA